MFFVGCTNWAKNDDHLHCGGSKYNKEVGFSQTPIYFSCEVIALDTNEILS